MVEMRPLTEPHNLHQIDLTQTAAAAKDVTLADDQADEATAELVKARKVRRRAVPLTSDSGSACCVSMPHPTDNKDNMMLQVGVSHGKTPFGRKRLEGKVRPNQYLSRFFTFQADPPYRVVAVSPYFCLPGDHPPSNSKNNGNSTNAANNNNTNPLIRVSLWDSLEFSPTGRPPTQDKCQAIHFVTGITEHAQDTSKLIIAYGAADCVPWFVQVDKAQVMVMLFPTTTATTTT